MALTMLEYIETTVATKYTHATLVFVLVSSFHLPDCAYITALDSRLTPGIPVGVMMWRGPINGPLSLLADGGCMALGKWPICD